jgi:hypothetical protein
MARPTEVGLQGATATIDFTTLLIAFLSRQRWLAESPSRL